MQEVTVICVFSFLKVRKGRPMRVAVVQNRRRGQGLTLPARHVGLRQRFWTRTCGPRVIVAQFSVGGGEWVLLPEIVTNYSRVKKISQNPFAGEQYLILVGCPRLPLLDRLGRRFDPLHNVSNSIAVETLASRFHAWVGQAVVPGPAGRTRDHQVSAAWKSLKEGGDNGTHAGWRVMGLELYNAMT